MQTKRISRVRSVLDSGLSRLRAGNGSNGNGKARADEQPLRSEIFSIAQLERHAKSIAGWHVLKPDRAGRRGKDRLLPRLAKNQEVLAETYEIISDAVKLGRRITPASEWFLDNYHLIEEQIRTARRHLPSGYSRVLPKLAVGPMTGYPRVYDLALELIAHVDGRIDGESVRAFVAAYETVSPLRIGELWAIPIMLRFALLENLRRVATRLADGRRERELAALWVGRMLETANREPASVVLVLADMVRADPPLTTPFVAEFAAQLQGHSATLVFPMAWLEQRLAEQGDTLDRIFQDASQNQAADQVSVGNSITSLRFLGAAEWRDFVENLSAVEQTLREDPAKVYPLMDFATRDRYRHVIEEIARRSRMEENDVAKEAVNLAKESTVEKGRTDHVGFYLIDRGRVQLEKKAKFRPSLRIHFGRALRGAALPVFTGALTLFTIIAAAAALFWGNRHGMRRWEMIVLAFPLLIGLSHLCIALVNWVSALIIAPRTLPRLDFSHGIPPEQRTIVAVPTMLTDRREVEKLLEDLEIRYLANRDDSLYFALLSDFKDAPSENLPEDEELLARAREGIIELNTRHGNGNGGQFFLFHRARLWNPSENVWMGWERKRGKLEEFNAALRGDETKFDEIVGQTEKLVGIKYVITLDSDTQLPRDTARQMIGAIAHPLNHARFDAKAGRVTEGYGILQPRVGISMPSAGRSRFAMLFAGDPGIDPYTQAVSDTYQDCFCEGSYIGKGIYEVDVFTAALGGRLPVNQILSHDLLEGGHARSGLLSDVVLFEEYPAAYPADVSRRYRWMRGDWQIAPWLIWRVPHRSGENRPNPINALSRWKILDNLRRSLVPASLLAVLVLGWLFPGGAWFFSMLVVTIFLLPAVLVGLTELARRPKEMRVMRHTRLVGRTLGRQLLQGLFLLACLPFDAYMGLNAILRTLWRMHFTRKKLLEWRTAHEAEHAAPATPLGFYSAMWAAPVAAIALTLALSASRAHSLAVVEPFVALWLISPGVAWWLSKPLCAAEPYISADDRKFLLALARRVWRFFETFVVAADNFLPPDNYQEDPPVGVAHRTSPTNIGLSLLANLSACDFGFISDSALIQRTAQTLDTLDKMPRYRGHFFNWYDTRTLEVLRPQYVSTVDSGNLAAHLVTLAAGLDEIHHLTIFRKHTFDGLDATMEILLGLPNPPPSMRDSADNLQRLRGFFTTPPRTLSASHDLLNRVSTACRDLEQVLKNAGNDELKWWSAALTAQCRQFLDDLKAVAPWAELPASSPPGNLRELLRKLDEIPTLNDAAQLEMTLLPALDQAAGTESSSEWFKNLRSALLAGAENAARRLNDLRQLAIRCREFADLDYSFLYDEVRRLMYIGYNVTERRPDQGYYDLLASEARLGSFLAIAQGKLPQEHWFRLGRLLTNSGGRTALLSWSGSMFEYLMPLLVMPTYQHTLLDETYRAVVRRQIEYGRERGVPWGISESGYDKTDAHLNYQYRAFGVPGLGFKRGLADDLVIAPYASVMALMVEPAAACANLHRLAEEDRLGKYGFYEAIDYTSSRLPPDRESSTIASFMAHHQGMCLLSLEYVLLDHPMQRRFESDPALRATDLLLQERVPHTPAVFPHPAEVSEARAGVAEAQANVRVYTNPNATAPQVHLLSNGRYHVAVTAAGGGYSRWRELAVTRWHEDPTRDCWGTFCYLRDIETGQFWSSAHQPTLKRADSYEAIFSQGRAEYRRRDGAIDTHVEISVSPEDDIELRRITLTNRGEDVRQIELTSYAEVVMAQPAADASHPAFSNLFVQTQIVRERQAILCTRRARSASEKPPWMLHQMIVHGTTIGSESYESGREQFLGRGRSLDDPAAMHEVSLSDSEGSVLDPIVAIRNIVTLRPNESARINLVTGMAETREAAMGLVEKYADRHLADRVFELAWTHSQVVLRQLDASEPDTQLYARLAGSILYTNPLLRAPASVIARNQRGQSGLWGYGISGDLPIVLLRISDKEQIQLVRQLVGAHAYWRVKGLAVDLVIWNEDHSGYRQQLQEMIMGVISSRAEASLLDKPGGIFVRRVEQMSEEDKVLMQTVARVIITDTAGSLAEQVDRRTRAESPTPRFSPLRQRRFDLPVATEIVKRDLVAFNGIGGFTRDGREYVITTTNDKPTPAPWVNVIANPFFGTVVSESGSAYTWCENAQSYRITPWSNDPISDIGGEAFYLRDEESGRYFSPCPFPARGQMPYVTRHGFGYSVFEYAEGGITSEMRTYVAIDAPVKFVTIKLHNGSGRPRRFSVTAFLELILGERRSSTGMHVWTEIDPKTGAVLARNPYSSEFAQRVAFLDCGEAQRTVTGDRMEFLGRNSNPARPAAMGRTRLSGRVGASLDPCAVMQVIVDLAEGQEREIAFIFGSGRDLTDARNLIFRFRGIEPAQRALEGVWGHWNRVLGAVYVETPDASLNYLTNGWLLYQTLSSRIWGRSGFYQSGGAFGFRDQLQDVMALIHADPAILRAHLIRCASRQFKEGDVQHWWHPPSGRGVRTHISDDYLWLPFAVCHYVAAMGDTGVLDEKANFLEGRLPKPDEDSYYDLPHRSEEIGTLYEHCVRAVKHGLRFGEHGLPLMGSGDWNDGMNLVGEKGRGESVWLAFMLYTILTQFSEIARQRGDGEFAELCVNEAAKLKQNIEANAWDGEWYRRAYFDNGEPLGSSANTECKIDSLPQSWSVISKAGPAEHVTSALKQVDAQLVKRDIGIIQLFDPPFDHSNMDPGYIKGYVPGVRENGGQYTHAAIWTVMAFAQAGQIQKAWELFNLINPVHHGNDEKTIARYKVEPYVVAADVYANPQHAGRGGWTWYTGSAGWMYRLITECLLGLKLEIDRLRVTPLLPREWEFFKMHYRYRETFHHILVKRVGPGEIVSKVIADGAEQPEKTIPLIDDRREHQAEVHIGTPE